MSPSRARRCASAASRTAWPGRLISSDALMNAHPHFVLVWSAFSITSKSARITSSPVSSARRLAFVSRPSRARRLRSLSASATSRSLEPKCWYRVRFVTPARAAIASTPVPVMPRAYVSSLVAARSVSCAFGRSVMPVVYEPIGVLNPSAHLDRHEGPRLSRPHARCSQRSRGLSRSIVSSTLEDKTCSIPIGMYTTGEESRTTRRKGVEHASRKGESARGPLMSPSARGSPSELRPRSWPAEPSACDSQSFVPHPETKLEEERFMAKTVGPFSPWRRIAQTIATSGQIGLGDDGKMVEGGFRPELEQTLRNLSNVLADAGVTREQVIKVNVYLADLADWPALNGPYAEFFGSSLPARTAFATSALPFGARVEIEAWAVVEGTR